MDQKLGHIPDEILKVVFHMAVWISFASQTSICHPFTLADVRKTTMHYQLSTLPLVGGLRCSVETSMETSVEIIVEFSQENAVETYVDKSVRMTM